MNLIYDIKEIKKLLVDLHNVSGYRVALFDSDFMEIMAYPSRISSVCGIIRSNDELLERCKQCDRESFMKSKITGQVVIYQCHAGFTEMIIPIQARDINIAYIMCGQISKFDEETSLYNYLCEFDLEHEEIRKIEKEMDIATHEKINSIANIIKLSANYLYQEEKIKMAQDTLAYQIDNYILENITEKIDVEKMCEQFHYRKTKFYEIISQMYGVGIMKHIRQLRVQLAKQLLATTDFPVSEISAKVGIPDYNYFTKVFKEEAFCTPREYRKNNISKLY